mmetsp:Transcript_29693/g.59406  ORF Transcript_29693/g.59406 Transcript_29693/m.59406 type:complete len:867 (-) Transcript_29693:53-2653(-)
MPLPPPPSDLLAQIQSKKNAKSTATSAPDGDGSALGKAASGGNNPLLAAIQNHQSPAAAISAPRPGAGHVASSAIAKNNEKPTIPPGELFIFNTELEAFQFDLSTPEVVNARLSPDRHGNEDVDIIVPLAPCVYRMTDYTYAKKEPVLLTRCVNKLGVLRCLKRECNQLNALLSARLEPIVGRGGSIEEDELSKTRFMELLSNCGVYQKVSELIISRCNNATDIVAKGRSDGNTQQNPYHIPQVRVQGLAAFLNKIEEMCPALGVARDEIRNTQTVSFHPGLGELFSPGAKLICFPEGMEGTPLGVSCVQSWYDEELNRATNKVKRRFILVVEFMVSVGEEIVFVAASEVYPEFHDLSRNVPVRDLNHRRLDPNNNRDDATLIQRLQNRGEFYASVASDNHYLEYYANAFYPIIGGWGNNAMRPLSKGGRVMVDVKRGALEGHIPVRGSADGMSDTVKEAMKLFDQSKRTGVAVPFRTAILPGFCRDAAKNSSQDTRLHESLDSDRDFLWMAWPMLTGFSFTARCWGKILLSLPKASDAPASSTPQTEATDSPVRPSMVRMGVSLAALGGVGKTGNVNYIKFQEHAFEQLVLAEEKKELIRAVARNAGGGSNDSDLFGDDDDEEDDEIGLDVVANKGAASIFLLSGPPGCGKTLTAEAIAELLKKPLYVVTAGDLGITASEVEKSLGGVLDLCSTWDALVLVDEADIFLEERGSTEIQRNALVCVMLRLLEYYSGCLFLSSNRDAKRIDAAIASRITVMLSYPPLDVDGRAKVWKNLVELVPARPLDSAGKVIPRIAKNPRKLSKYRMDFTDEDYQTLASGFHLNGRQIKNSIVLARALSRERGVPLSLEILKRAVTAVAGENCFL